ncbi:MAG: chromate transporter [Hyphomicrobiales bacterium]|nr:chromate transporter [Hyphomicrobiales bacterium]
MDAQEEAVNKHTATFSQVLLSFLKIGGSAFGGSTQALIFREVVDRRQWMSEQQFLTGQAIAQVLPGANPVNLALYVGLQVRGGLGATAAVLGMIAPAFCIILVMGFAYRELSGQPATHFVLGGVAAAGVGATLAMGFKIVRKMPRKIWPAAIALAVFAAIGFFRLPMIPVVLIAVPLSIAAAYFDARRAG